MAAAKPLVAFLLCLVAAAANASASPSPDGGGHLLPADPAPTGCRGAASARECLAGDDEELGRLHRHGRALYGSAGAGYISYGALRGDSVPCSRRGASYHSCSHGAQASPYRRGGSRIRR